MNAFEYHRHVAFVPHAVEYAGIDASRRVAEQTSREHGPARAGEFEIAGIGAGG